MIKSPRKIGIEGNFFKLDTDYQLKSKLIVKALETFPLKEKRQEKMFAAVIFNITPEVSATVFTTRNNSKKYMYF